MPYADGYIIGGFKFDHDSGKMVRLPLNIKGTISIKDIDPEYIARRIKQGIPVFVGEIMPWSMLKVVD